MRETKYHAYLDSEERTILLHSLVELKNQLIQQGRYTDCVDELIVKVINIKESLSWFCKDYSNPKRSACGQSECQTDCLW